MADFNREMLILARESRGLTQTELAEQGLFSQAEISKFETGVKIPTDEQVRGLASHLHYPQEFFYANETVRDFGSGCVYHRRRKTSPEAKLKQLLMLVNLRRIHVKRLLTSVNTTSEFTFEELAIDEFDGNAVCVAQALRAIWKIPPGPVQNVVNIIESAGGIIVSCDFGTDKIDALSQWLPGLPPVFLVNSRIPTDRLRWTLVHEIGHIVMHRFPTDQMEKEADQFTAEFLLPEEEVKKHLYDLSLPKLAQLKPYWRVSMNALLRRAGDLQTIAPRTKSYLWMQMGQRGYRTHEPVDIPPETPSLLKDLLAVHREKLGYGTKELAQMLLLKESEVLTYYGDCLLGNSSRSGLRLVRQ